MLVNEELKNGVLMRPGREEMYLTVPSPSTVLVNEELKNGVLIIPGREEM